MRKVKCRICKKELPKEQAYKVKKGKTNQYYCTKEEYDNLMQQKEDRLKCLDTIAKIMNIPMIPPVMVKQINTLNSFYTYGIIKKTFEENKQNIQWVLENKDFKSEFAKTKYIISIVANNINKVFLREREMDKQVINKKTDIVDVDIFTEEIVTTKRKVSDISDFLD